MRRSISSLTCLLLLASCGRGAKDVDVRLTGVGMDPDEIGPTPTAYGGVVEIDHVDLAGAGLPLAFMGLLGYDEVGPAMIGFAPPYNATFAFSYLFDQKLEAGATLSQLIPVPPAAPDTCYTSFDPEGPIGSFTTVDVGDYLEFRDANDRRVLRINRSPADYPPDAQNLFIYYFDVQTFQPGDRMHWVPDPADPTNPAAMTQVPYRVANFPFDSELSFHFPGGFSKIDQPVSSIPRPSSASPLNTIAVPSQLGGVMMQWKGPHYYYQHGDQEGWVQQGGDHKACVRYYQEEGTQPAGIEDCNPENDGNYPTDGSIFDSFKGQVYTGPWDTDDGKVDLNWTPGGTGEVIVSVRFLAELDTDDPAFQSKRVTMHDGRTRPAQACDADAEWAFDESQYEGPDGNLIPSLWGDPFSRMAEVTCLVEDDGEFSLTNEMLADAMTYGEEHGIGGAVFMIARGTEAEAEVPAAKDQYDQRHDISPVRLAARTIKVGRLWWDRPAEPADGGAE